MENIRPDPRTSISLYLEEISSMLKTLVNNSLTNQKILATHNSIIQEFSEQLSENNAIIERLEMESKMMTDRIVTLNTVILENVKKDNRRYSSDSIQDANYYE